MKVISHANKALALVGNTPSVSRTRNHALTDNVLLPNCRVDRDKREFHWIPPCVAFSIPFFVLASTLGPVDGLALMGKSYLN